METKDKLITIFKHVVENTIKSDELCYNCSNISVRYKGRIVKISEETFHGPCIGTTKRHKIELGILVENIGKEEFKILRDLLFEKRKVLLLEEKNYKIESDKRFLECAFDEINNI